MLDDDTRQNVKFQRTLFNRTPRPVESQIFAVRENAVHHVTELVEKCAHFGEFEQRGLIGSGLREVSDH